jgi:hypothetical protein
LTGQLQMQKPDDKFMNQFIQLHWQRHILFIWDRYAYAQGTINTFRYFGKIRAHDRLCLKKIYNAQMPGAVETSSICRCYCQFHDFYPASL